MSYNRSAPRFRIGCDDPIKSSLLLLLEAHVSWDRFACRHDTVYAARRLAWTRSRLEMVGRSLFEQEVLHEFFGLKRSLHCLILLGKKGSLRPLDAKKCRPMVPLKTQFTLWRIESLVEPGGPKSPSQN